MHLTKPKPLARVGYLVKPKVQIVFLISTIGTCRGYLVGEGCPDSNVKNLVPTVHEIIALVDDYKFQILGKIPYKLDDGGMGLYVGHSVNGKTKKRLPEGWSIGVSDEYYGLRYYNDGEKTHWKHPLE